MSTKTSASTSPLQFYRFGICGGTSSGKTCILTALAVPRPTHERDYSANLLPLPRRPEQDLVSGMEWMEKDAKPALLGGSVPPPTPPSIKNLTLRYTVCGGPSLESFIECRDYSGELMNPAAAQSDLAQSLRDYLVGLDGLMIIAEYPRASETASSLAPELHRLRATFAELSERRKQDPNARPVPMALLVNKWDRAGSIGRGPGSHDAQMQRVQTFLEGTLTATVGTDGEIYRPPHAGLFAEMSAASGKRALPFPVSAFGKCASDPTLDTTTGAYVERPALIDGELHAFGLEEPLLWLIEQCDSSDVQWLQTQATPRKVLLNPVQTYKSKGVAKRLTSRLAEGSPLAPAAQAALRRLTTLQRVQEIAAVLILTFAALFTEYAFDARGHTKVLAIMQDSSSTVPWDEMQAWHASYITAKPWRHLLYRMARLSRDEASAERQHELDRREMPRWQSVVDAKDPTTQADLASAYLVDFPHGPHGDEARVIVKVRQFQIEHDRLSGILAVSLGEYNGIQTRFKKEDQQTRGQGDYAPLRTPLKSLIGRLETLGSDFSSHGEDTLTTSYNSLFKDSTTLSAAVEDRWRETETRAAYAQNMQAQQVTAAAIVLLTRASTSTFDDLRASFRQTALPILRSRVTKELGSGEGYDKASATLAEFTGDRRVLTLIDPATGSTALAEMDQQLKQTADSYMYGQIPTSPNAPDSSTISAINYYLRNAPLKTMQRPLLPLLNFLQVKGGILSFRVYVSSVNWGLASSGTYENSITIGGKGENYKAVLPSASFRPAWRAGYASQSAHIEFTGNASDPLALRVSMVAVGTFNDDDLGTATVTTPLDKWLDAAISASLLGAEAGSEGTTITLAVEYGANGQWQPFIRPRLQPWSPVAL